jgi:hypothetical protein
VAVKTVVLGPPPGELAALIERRQRQALDMFDEMWKGSYHMAPALHPSHGCVANELTVLLAPCASRVGLVGTGPFNLGSAADFRVPDGGFHRSLPTTVWVSTAAVVVEIVSPDDETYDKFAFYAQHGVDELLVADPATRRVRCWGLEGERYVETASSELLEVTVDELTYAIPWP